jgi:3-oxoacyl-[acyl-carrier-protein] synthase II
VNAVITGAAVSISGLSEVAGLLPAGAVAIDPGTGRTSAFRDRASDLALSAVGAALAAAGLNGERPGLPVATVVSTSYGALEQACLALDTITRSSTRALSPRLVHAMSSHVIGTWVSIEYGFRGPCLTLCDGPTSGLDAVHWARNMIAAARAEVVVIIGVEPRTDPVLRLLGQEGSEPAVLDGAAAIVLEAESHAVARGARPRAVFEAYSRAAQLAAALPQRPRPVDWWFAPEPAEPGDITIPAAPAALAGVRRIDLASGLGRSSSALGVIQVALASALVEEDRPSAALAVCGGKQDIAVAVVSSVAGQADSSGTSVSRSPTA